MGTFPSYRFETIRQRADQVRKTYTKKPNAIPVDIDHIVEFGYRLEVRPLKNLKSSLDMEGMLSKDRTTIFVDSDTYTDDRFYNRHRFTLAHEIGHYELHSEYYRKAQFETPEEWVALLQSIDPDELEWCERHADEFAGRLLVPIEILNDEIDRLRPELRKLEEMAVDFGIDNPDEVQKRKAVYVARMLGPKFEVSQKVIEIRIRTEKLNL
jgi:Zn-dependent peptidase ImmA (M78 family)